MYDLTRCAEWINENHFEKVCLQFSNDCIEDATTVAEQLISLTSAEVYITAENESNGCCVDQIVARQAGVTSIIHFGDCCETPVSEELPILTIPRREPLDVNLLCSAIEHYRSDPSETFTGPIILDQRYAHHLELIRQQLANVDNIFVVNNNIALLQKGGALYVGGESNRLNYLMLKNPLVKFASVNPSTMLVRRECLDVNVKLRKRLYLIEKAKQASVVGILVGSLSLKNRLVLERRVKDAARLAGKKSYTFSIKKVTPAKLANFPEIDIFVYIGCPYSLILDCSEFYKPLISSYEFDIACGPATNAWNPAYGLLSQFDTPAQVEPTSVVEQDEHTSKDGPQYFLHRSWKGLNVDAAECCGTSLVKGLSGVAVQYDNELA